MTLEYRTPLRPCYVKAYKHVTSRPYFVEDGERKALFHGWHACSQLVDASPLKGGHSGGQVSSPVAIVEFEDGTVSMVPPAEIRFVDSSFGEYYFGEEKDG